MTGITIPDLIEALEGTGVLALDYSDGSYQISYDVIETVYNSLQNDLARLNLVDPSHLIWFGRKRG